MLLLMLLVAGCRGSGANVPIDAGPPDLAPPPPLCVGSIDCYDCCSTNFESGALVYDENLNSCACDSTTCLSACTNTVCGSNIGIDKPCETCLAGTLGDGGACTPAQENCITTDSPCALFADCISRCPR